MHRTACVFTPSAPTVWRKSKRSVDHHHRMSSCSSSNLSREGRCDDICYFASLEEGTKPFYPDTIRRMILLASADIADYQVVQEACGQLRIHLATVPGASFAVVEQAVRASVNATVRQYACHPATVRVEQGLMPLTPGVKRRRVQAMGR